MKPAMTTEMWSGYLGESRRVEITDPNGDVLVLVRGEKKETPEAGIHHAIAAVALHGKSFGFTHGDVAALRAQSGVAGVAVQAIQDGGYECRAINDNPLWSLADRIEALLAPVEVVA